MLDDHILRASPHVSAYGARPLTVDEIDAHPDRARIWATIMSLHGIEDAAYEEGAASARIDNEDEVDAERAECVRRLDIAVRGAVKKLRSLGVSDEAVDLVSDLAEALS